MSRGCRTRIRPDTPSCGIYLDTYRAKAELGQAMSDMERRLTWQIGDSASRTANVIIEHVRDDLRVYDDKQRHLPAEVDSLRRRMDRVETHLGLDEE
jgi:hypothetical protein